MAKAGFWINIVSIILILVVAYTLMGFAFGIEAGVVPEWVKG